MSLKFDLSKEKSTPKFLIFIQPLKKSIVYPQTILTGGIINETFIDT